MTVVDVNEAECQETVRVVQQTHAQAGAHAHSYKLDVTSRDDVYAFAKRLEAEKSPVDILVNNAGIVQAGSILSTSEDQIFRIINVNLLAQFWVSLYHKLFKHLIGTKSTLLCVLRRFS